jgi:catechol 2,3-dioxygenase-like lactoylglutathione lyase family enzyme
MTNTMQACGIIVALLLGVPASAVFAQEAAPAATPAATTDLQIAGPVLMVADLERSLRFYTQGLGMAVGNRLGGSPGPGAIVVGSGPDRTPFILLRQRDQAARTDPPLDIGQGLSRIMLTAPDVKAVAVRLKSAGYEAGTPSARNIFFVTDPDGYRYEVMQE